MFRDRDELIVGFWGLALPEMPHRFEIGGIQLYAWCAWDPLFIAPLLRKPGRVCSVDPVTGTQISLTVTDRGVEDLSHPDAVVPFLAPDRPFDQHAVQQFCHFVLLFATRDSGTEWVAAHPGTFLVTSEEAYEVGRLANLRRFAATEISPRPGPSHGAKTAGD